MKLLIRNFKSASFGVQFGIVEALLGGIIVSGSLLRYAETFADLGRIGPAWGTAIAEIRDPIFLFHGAQRGNPSAIRMH